eukprot:GCRY01001670.1.p2 GENE.GCRY01001670.1~~GCRY01001670.1.p2  ORF type:complete len:135 (+),score=33.58 GCRY01001670.1:665-1069(+)
MVYDAQLSPECSSDLYHQICNFVRRFINSTSPFTCFDIPAQPSLPVSADSSTPDQLAAEEQLAQSLRSEGMDAIQVKMIDFAHSYNDGDGRDEGYMLGLRSLVLLFEGLLRQSCAGEAPVAVGKSGNSAEAVTV